MNKLELIGALRDECQISKNEAAAIVDIFFDQISTALAEGDRVEIRGLCSFFVKEYKSYQGRNPRTGETVMVVPKKLPYFKIGKELKERVDYWLIACSYSTMYISLLQNIICFSPRAFYRVWIKRKSHYDDDPANSDSNPKAL